MARNSIAGGHRLLSLYETVKRAGREGEERERIIKALTEKPPEKNIKPPEPENNDGGTAETKS